MIPKFSEFFTDSEDCIPQEYGSCLTAEEIDDQELIHDKFV